MSKNKVWYHGWVIVENPRILREGKAYMREGIYKPLEDDKEPYAKRDLFYFNDIRSFWNNRHTGNGVIAFKNRRKNEIAFTKIVEIGLEDVGDLIRAFNEKMNTISEKR
jgi:hypothetical protein